MSNYTNPVYYYPDGTIVDDLNGVVPDASGNLWVKRNASDWSDITGSLTMPFDNNSVSIGYIDNRITHNWDSEKLYELLFEALVNEEPDSNRREMYKLILVLNNNDYRNTVLEIEMEKNESTEINS